MINLPLKSYIFEHIYQTTLLKITNNVYKINYSKKKINKISK